MVEAPDAQPRILRFVLMARIAPVRREGLIALEAFFGTLIHRALIATEVQDAMSGVLAILVVLGLLVLVSAKHAPDGLRATAEAREATKRPAGLDIHSSSPGQTFEAARWRTRLDSLEQ
jgi:hypothetical protein